MLVSAIITLIRMPSTAVPAAGIVVPWATTGVHGPVITVAIWYFILAVGVTVLVHEGAHAVVAAAHKLKLKSSGVGLFAIIPFAFVEPDEVALRKEKTSRQLSVFAAAPFTNIVLAIFIGMLTVFLVAPSLAVGSQINGLAVTEINASLPAGASNLEIGDIVVRVDNTSFIGVNAESAIVVTPDYKSVLRMPASYYDCLEVVPGQNVTLVTDNGKSVSIEAIARGENKSKGVMGLSFAYVIRPKEGRRFKTGALGILYNLLAWIAIFNIGIGLFNLLPIGGLDGGRMVRLALERIFKKKKTFGKKVFAWISMLVLFVLLLSIFGKYIVNIF